MVDHKNEVCSPTNVDSGGINDCGNKSITEANREPHKQVLFMGLDSFIVQVVYALGLLACLLFLSKIRVTIISKQLGH